MSTTYKLSRPLAAAIAIAALAAPSAGAMPMHEPSEYDAGHASLALHRHAQQVKQDLRSPDARDAEKYPKGTGGVSQLDMGRPLPPTWPKNPQPLHAVPSPTTDDGFPWATVGIGLAGAGIALGGIATLSRRTRIRVRRTRVAA